MSYGLRVIKGVHRAHPLGLMVSSCKRTTRAHVKTNSTIPQPSYDSSSIMTSSNIKETVYDSVQSYLSYNTRVLDYAGL